MLITTMESDHSSNFRIETASLDDMKWITGLYIEQGWNAGLKDYLGFHIADPLGYFIGLLNGKPLGCVSAVKFNTLGELGYLIVKKEYRGLGYGSKLYHHALNHLKGYNVRIDALLQSATNHERHNFKSYYQCCSLTGVVEKVQVSCQNIHPTNQIPFNKLVEYDSRYYGDERKHFLASWLGIATTTSLVYIDKNDEIQGLGVIRKSLRGYRFGPFYAESLDIAQALFFSLLQSLEDLVDNKCRIGIDPPCSNENAMKLAQMLKLELTYRYTAMYNKEAPMVNLSNVYCITIH